MKEFKAIENLTEYFQSFTGVGHKSAERMAFEILEMDENRVKDFCNAIQNVKKTIHKCPVCGSYTENDICEICSDYTRNNGELIVVAFPKDITSFEKLNLFKGKYHVLNGLISPYKSLGIDDLNVESLFERIEKEKIREVILAIDATIEGETTSLYLAKLLEKKNISVSRLAYGLPIGGHLEYADSLTLKRAFEGRKKV